MPELGYKQPATKRLDIIQDLQKWRFGNHYVLLISQSHAQKCIYFAKFWFLIIWHALKW